MPARLSSKYNDEPPDMCKVIIPPYITAMMRDHDWESLEDRKRRAFYTRCNMDYWTSTSHPTHNKEIVEPETVECSSRR